MNQLKFRLFLIGTLLLINAHLYAAAADSGMDGVTDAPAKKAEVTKPIYLRRSDAKGTELAKYVDRVDLSYCSLDLKRSSLGVTWTERAHALAEADTWASHLFVRGVRVVKQKGSYSSSGGMFQGSFLGVSDLFGHKPIVWVSKGRHNTEKESDDYHYSISHVENCHAEPQFMADFDYILKTRPQLIVQSLMPAEDGELLMAGIDLYGSYDACNDCLFSLIDFRQSQQNGKTGIVDAMRDKLKDRFICEDEDSFLIFYHGFDAYANKSGSDDYAVETDDDVHVGGLKYNPILHTFAGTDAEYEGVNTLSHAPEKPTKISTIYTHLHGFGLSSVAKYDSKEKYFKFIPPTVK